MFTFVTCNLLLPIRTFPLRSSQSPSSRPLNLSPPKMLSTHSNDNKTDPLSPQLPPRSLKLSRKDFIHLSSATFLFHVAPDSNRPPPSAHASSLADATVYYASKARTFKDHEAIFDTSIGSFLPPNPEILARTLKKHEATNKVERLIVLGETHTHPLHHRMQLDVVKALDRLRSQDQRPLSIGFEHFTRQHQRYLNEFNQGSITVDQLRQRVKWDENSSFSFNIISPILAYAQQNRIDIVGLNLPRQVTSYVAQAGFDTLPDEMKELLPKLDLDNQRHYTRFRKNIVGSHGAHLSETSLRFYYEALTLWDEYMAESAALHLKQTEKETGRLVILAGAAHVEDRNGLPDRIWKRSGLRPFTILPESTKWINSYPDIAAPPDKHKADWIWYFPREIDLV